MADQVVAKKHSTNVAGGRADCRLPTAPISLVQHVVMDEGRHVNHLDDRGQCVMGVRQVAHGFPAEQKEYRAKHFPPVGPYLITQAVDTGEFTGQFFIKNALRNRQIAPDRSVDIHQWRGELTHCVSAVAFKVTARLSAWLLLALNRLLILPTRVTSQNRFQMF